MFRLLKIDFRKYYYSKSFWILIAIYLSLNVLTFFLAELVLNNMVVNAEQNAPMQMTIPGFSLYDFPLIWHNLTFLGGFLKIFLALIVIISITNEFSQKTVRLNIMSGLSRNQFLVSKVFFVAIVSGLSTFILFLSGTILGLMKAEQLSFMLFFEKIEFIPAYFLELYTFTSIAMVVAFWLKRSGIAIGFMALYFYIIEPVLSFLVPEQLEPYLPMEAIGNLIDVPNSSMMQMFGVNFSEAVSMPDLVSCLIYCLLSFLAVYLMINRKDL